MDRTAQILRAAGVTMPKKAAPRRSVLRRAVAGAVVAALVGGGAAVAGALPASADSGGASVPGSGGTVGNVRTYGYMYDGFKTDHTPVQGYNSVDWFFANNPHGAPDASYTPNASEAMRAACTTALGRADARKGGSSGTSRVVGMFWATSASPAHVWGHGIETPARFKSMYDGWAAAGYPGVLTAGDGVPDLAAYHRLIDSAMNEAIADAAGQPIRAICLALNESEPPMQYSLSATTTAMDTFAVAGGDAPVYDMIHLDNGGSSIVENVEATTVMRYWGADGSTAEASKSKSVANNGDTPSQSFTPADFGWSTWPGTGRYCFDLQIPQQGGMDAPVDTPDQEPSECWSAWLPEPNKDVIGSSEESGDFTHDSINGKVVFPGQKLEYSIGIDLRIPAELRTKIVSFAVRDDYDPMLILDKPSIEFWDSRTGSPRPVPRSAYDLVWDDENTAFTATFTDAWVQQHIQQATVEGWLTLRGTGTVKDTAPPGYVLRNQAFQIMNGVSIGTEIPEVTIPDIDPAKDVVIAPGDGSIDGTEIPVGQVFNYRLDSSVIPGNRAYDVGAPWSITDPFDRTHDEYTGTWAVYANRDVYDRGQLIFAQGDLVQDSTGPANTAYGDLFTASFDEASYTYKVEATAAFLSLVKTRPDLEAAFSVYTQMIRIEPTDRVENQFTEHLDGTTRESNVVWTRTPKPPTIDVEKFTHREGHPTGDRDTKGDAYPIPDSELGEGTLVGFRVTNTGDVDLVNVVLTDTTHEGLAGIVGDIVCRRGGATVPAGSIGGLAAGESIDCQGVLTGMKPGQSHADTATVTGETVTGIQVTDEDPWHANTPAPAPAGALAVTGGQLDGVILIAAGVLLAGGVVFLVLAVRRRTQKPAPAASVPASEE